MCIEIHTLFYCHVAGHPAVGVARVGEMKADCNCGIVTVANTDPCRSAQYASQCAQCILEVLDQSPVLDEFLKQAQFMTNNEPPDASEPVELALTPEPEDPSLDLELDQGNPAMSIFGYTSPTSMGPSASSEESIGDSDATSAWNLSDNLDGFLDRSGLPLPYDFGNSTLNLFLSPVQFPQEMAEWTEATEASAPLCSCAARTSHGQCVRGDHIQPVLTTVGILPFSSSRPSQ